MQIGYEGERDSLIFLQKTIFSASEWLQKIGKKIPSNYLISVRIKACAFCIDQSSTFLANISGVDVNPTLAAYFDLI